MDMHALLQKPESADRLDTAADITAGAVDVVLGDGALARGLRGSWLGHPTHPLMVTLPIGAWMSSAVLDLVFKDREAARRLIAIGLAATPPAVLAGLAEFPTLGRRQRRVGLLHAAGNAVGAAAFLIAYRKYKRGRIGAARAFSVLGLTAVSVGGALGGHLSYAQGAGVHRWQVTG
ncbi:DUF2231 domain-containing protein [Mycolicibacterium flavescens]|uniref:DUF2231 domain-containing protein n=1 Tax=Mycolicibacterium flavescens TaxID=1776 RepID=A0A1E3RGD5_MYCFV|nr:DUF2231 domain-containing protein [Mycolicibacterium flavescens]MCV7278779.1 DUF2231 domain-containing protein [Mycolicibacterium flavescens]ODQ88522.1 DUF2231 domain-containing protein [Mycolicibacterium flavescens]